MEGGYSFFKTYYHRLGIGYHSEHMLFFADIKNGSICYG